MVRRTAKAWRDIGARWRPQIDDVVEVEMKEEGLFGSQYEARVLEINADQVLVQFSEFVSEEDPKRPLEEWADLDRVTPVPPPAPPEYLANAGPGAYLEIFFDGGWWAVNLGRKQRDGAYQVFNTQYGTERWAKGNCLRPRWKFYSLEPATWTASEPVGLEVYESSLDARQEQPRDDDDDDEAEDEEKDDETRLRETEAELARWRKHLGVLRRDARAAREHVCELQRDVRRLLPLARAAAEAEGGTLVEDPLVLRVPEAIPELES